MMSYVVYFCQHFFSSNAQNLLSFQGLLNVHYLVYTGFLERMFVLSVQHLKDTFLQPAGVDLAPDVTQFMYHLCLAQAQECIVEKSMTDNRKATIIGEYLVWNGVHQMKLVLVARSNMTVPFFEML